MRGGPATPVSSADMLWNPTSCIREVIEPILCMIGCPVQAIMRPLPFCLRFRVCTNPRGVLHDVAGFKRAAGLVTGCGSWPVSRDEAAARLPDIKACFLRACGEEFEGLTL